MNKLRRGIEILRDEGISTFSAKFADFAKRKYGDVKIEYVKLRTDLTESEGGYYLLTEDDFRNYTEINEISKLVFELAVENSGGSIDSILEIGCGSGRHLE